MNRNKTSAVTGKGQGAVTISRILNDGRVAIRVLGQDEHTARWASFELIIGWGEWMRLNESLYNDREEVAQSRIC